MNFKPDEKNIRSLLKSGCQFVIPRFQREYSWDKKRFPNIVSDHYSYRKVELWKHAKPLLFDLAEAFGYTVIFSNFERVIGYTIL